MKCFVCIYVQYLMTFNHGYDSSPERNLLSILLSFFYWRPITAKLLREMKWAFMQRWILQKGKVTKIRNLDDSLSKLYDKMAILMANFIRMHFIYCSQQGKYPVGQLMYGPPNEGLGLFVFHLFPCSSSWAWLFTDWHTEEAPTTSPSARLFLWKFYTESTDESRLFTLDSLITWKPGADLCLQHMRPFQGKQNAYKCKTKVSPIGVPIWFIFQQSR